jgi:prolyl 4-hydroxylase
MLATSLSDHIAVFADALAPAACRQIIAQFEADHRHHEVSARPSGHRFTQLHVAEAWPDQHEALCEVFLTHLMAYRQAMEARFWPPEFAFEQVRVKRYLPNGEEHFPPHVDVMGETSSRRFMTAMIYLNSPAGGETVFPNLDLRIAPETGKLLAFPPLWLFPHQGLPPRGEPKYILHTYLCYV